MAVGEEKGKNNFVRHNFVWQKPSELGYYACVDYKHLHMWLSNNFVPYTGAPLLSREEEAGLNKALLEWKTE